MRKVFYSLILSVLAFCCVCPDAFGWAKLGHATVARIAENHLTPRARKMLSLYLDGLPLAAIASDADAYRGQWVHDLGFVPVNPDEARPAWMKGFDFSLPMNMAPYSHMITVDKDFVCFRTDNVDGEFINNIAFYVERLASALRDGAEDMTAQERYRTIALIVHFMGDMHCPVHIVYRPDNQLKGKYEVTWRGEKCSMHGVWDKLIFDAYYDWSFSDLAGIVDTYDKSMIADVVQGDVYDYAGSSARACWPAVAAYGPGAELPATFALDMRELLFSQLRNAGYRLAAVLNAALR